LDLLKEIDPRQDNWAQAAREDKILKGFDGGFLLHLLTTAFGTKRTWQSRPAMSASVIGVLAGEKVQR
jgi:hypothetical protein